MEIMMTFTNGTNDILAIPSGNLDLWALANSNLQEFLIEITVVYYLIYLMGTHCHFNDGRYFKDKSG